MNEPVTRLGGPKTVASCSNAGGDEVPVLHTCLEKATIVLKNSFKGSFIAFVVTKTSLGGLLCGTEATNTALQSNCAVRQT